MIYLLLGLFSLVVAYWLACSPFRWMGKGIKWLFPWPILGNTAGSLVSTVADFWHNFYRNNEDEDLVGFHMFTVPAIMPIKPKVVKQILITDSDSYTSRGFFVRKDDYMTGNLFTTEGEEWKLVRAKMTPYFSPTRIKAMVPIVENILDEYVEHSQKHKNGLIDIVEVSIKYSTNVIIAIAFGLEPDCFRNPKSFFFKLYMELSGLMNSLKILIGIMSPTLYRALGFSGFSKGISEQLIGYVKSVMEARSRGEGVRPDFMQGMVELCKKDIDRQDVVTYNKDGTEVPVFNERKVFAHSAIMFVAGVDTTGNSLGFLFYELAMNECIQDRLRNEILEHKEKNGSLEPDVISTMPYLDMVVSEGLRKYPVAGVLTRMATRDTRIGNLDVPKGTFILVSIMGIHRNPKFYPDPDKFDPERFAAGTQREIGTYLPFGLGPKTCIGLRFAITELKHAACAVLTRFRLTPCEQTPTKITYDYGVSLNPAQPLIIKLNPL